MQSNPDISTGLYHGLEAWQVRTANATAVVSVFGGQLLSFIPDGQPDLLWLSPTRAELPTPIRGGVPVLAVVRSPGPECRCTGAWPGTYRALGASAGQPA